MTTDFVVTYRCTYRDGSMSLTEFFRGPEQECFRIARHIGHGSDDKQQIIQTAVIVGKAAEWEKFLEDNS